jgi:hypothetical protein
MTNLIRTHVGGTAIYFNSRVGLSQLSNLYRCTVVVNDFQHLDQPRVSGRFTSVEGAYVLIKRFRSNTDLSHHFEEGGCLYIINDMTILSGGIWGFYLINYFATLCTRCFWVGSHPDNGEMIMKDILTN